MDCKYACEQQFKGKIYSFHTCLLFASGDFPGGNAAGATTGVGAGNTTFGGTSSSASLLLAIGSHVSKAPDG